jgi:predicted enzyme related to lactoylglutathione lyase
MHLVLVLDCDEPERLADFWAAALGYTREPLVEPYLVLKPAPDAAGPELILQRVAEPKSTKNRMHFDMRIDDLDGEVRRLETLGARKLGDEVVEAGFHWFVMADPEGNEFCVCREPIPHG